MPRRRSAFPKPMLPPYPTLEMEQEFWGDMQLYRVAGVDEVGRGAWAGPVVAAAVILPHDKEDLLELLHGVRDSKVMTAKQRERMYLAIMEIALAVGIGEVAADGVDHGGILAATRQAMWQALGGLYPKAEALLIDAVDLTQVAALPQRSVPFGDARSLSIAAASIVAKVTRDRQMVNFDEIYPGYRFGRHKGYGTKAHRAAVEELGVCSIHRRSFAPVAARYARQNHPQLMRDDLTPRDLD